MLPHHAKEIERLTKQHHFMMSTTAGQLLASHVTAGNGPLRVLDAGCADGLFLFPPNASLDLARSRSRVSGLDCVGNLSC